MISADLAIDSYLASKRASHHKLRTFAELGPRGYFMAIEQHKWSQEDTKAFLEGRATEDALQRPAEYAAKYITKPAGMNFSTKEGKAWRAEKQTLGLNIVEGETARAIESLVQTIDVCPVAQSLIQSANMQVTVCHDDVSDRWNVPGIQCRPDWLGLDGSAATEWAPYALDLKKTDHLYRLSSGRSIIKYGYNRQAAMVRMCLEREGVDISGFRYLLLGAETSFPYRWQVVEIPTLLIDKGQVWCERQLDRLSEHYTVGEWPLVSAQITVADIPAWLDDSEAA